MSILKRHNSYFLFVLIFSLSKTYSQSAYHSGYANPATDALGRKLPSYEETGRLKKDKLVGIFYWTWHTHHANEIPNNITEFLKKDPKAIDNYDHPIWPKKDSPFFWAEPLFGYYRDTDKWVLRKHAEMLADAGVDVIIFDCTNGNMTWKESYRALLEVFDQARKDGVPAPSIAFMLPFWNTPGGKEILHELYNELYKPGLYKDLWFIWKGKPFIMGSSDFAEDSIPTSINKEMKDFFTFRPGQPVYNKGPEKPDHWGWLEIYPQHGFVPKADGKFEQVTVGVAQNWSKERGLTAMNAPGAFGRSYTSKGQHTEPGAVNFGYNFQEQWDQALKLDPEFIFITGWNEWIAGRFREWQQQHNAFPDEFNQEGSRDVEPMKGGHGDNYYYQMMANIRKFKGLPTPIPASGPQNISIDGTFSDWNLVQPSFYTYKGSTLHRDSPGWKGFHYINNTGRNDITLAKVAYDDANIYFYVETSSPLSPSSDPSWMRLFIDVDKNKTTGWQGYDFVINRKNPKSYAVIEKNIKGWKWAALPANYQLQYSVSGNKMEIKIPRAALGLDKNIDFEFKWSDNMQNEGDVMDFWLNGDAAPGGRSNYHYKVTK